MNDIAISILGNYSFGQFVGFCFFFLIGLAMYQFQEVNERNKKSPHSPYKFSFKFMIVDNLRRFVVAAIFIYVQFRFFKELTGQELTEFTALLIGYMGNGLANFEKRNIRTLKRKRHELYK